MVIKVVDRKRESARTLTERHYSPALGQNFLPCILQNFKSFQQQFFKAFYLSAMQYKCLPIIFKLQLIMGELY